MANSINYFYVLDYNLGCCDIFAVDNYNLKNNDANDILESRGYNINNVEYMVTKELNIRFDDKFNGIKINNKTKLLVS